MFKQLLLCALMAISGVHSKTITRTRTITTVCDNQQTSLPLMASEQDCLKYINSYRNKYNVRPIKINKQKRECAQKQVSNKKISCGESAQSTCSESSIQKCLSKLVGSNRDAKLLRSSKYDRISCAKQNNRIVINYYQGVNVGSATTNMPQPTTRLEPSAKPDPTQTPSQGGDSYTQQVRDCVSALNNFRRSIGVADLAPAPQSQQQCANNAAINDASRGFHNSFGQCSERGQCECNGIMPVDRCIQAYINEGPGGGHYDIISSPRYTSVACGYDGGRFLAQNFY